MKKLFLLVLICLLPLQVFAISNLKLNGVATYTVTNIPVNVALTGDLAGNGNYTEIETYFDMNLNNVIDAGEILLDYMIITDGIGWIRDPGSPDDDIPGDETGVNGNIKTTLDIDQIEIMLDGQFIIKATEENGTSATAILKFDIQPSPPYITGKVTDKQSGAPLAQVMINADNVTDEERGGFAISDVNGDYFINVTAGTYKISTVTIGQPEYQPCDTLNVTIGASETKTVNIQLEKYTTFVEGYVKMANNSPVEGVLMVAAGNELTNFFSNTGTTNSSGYYKIGVIPDTIVVGASPLFQTSIAEDEYVDPVADTLVFAAGQTKQSNFTVKKYTTTIEGICKVNNQPLADVTISGTAIDFVAGTFNFYSTTSKEDGTYKLGVQPGVISMLTATKNGYSLVDPGFGYPGIIVEENQALTGYDFTFQDAGAGGNSISGQVTYENGTAAANVYVVAINDDEDSKDGYLITYTDASGNFIFEDLIEAQWQVGAYKSGYHTDPYMIFEQTYLGAVTDANFVLVAGETGIEEQNLAIAPLSFALAQNYPNPFNLRNGMNQTQIRFTLDQRKDIEISIFNIQGQLVKQVFSGNMDQGWHEVQWDGRDLTGNLAPTGTYFYRLDAENKSFTKRMVIIR